MKSTTPIVLTLLLVFLASCAQTSVTENTSQTPAETTPSQAEHTTTHETPAVQNKESETPHFARQIIDGNYTLDPAASTLTYIASRVVGTPHTGTVPLKSGTITLANQITQGIFLIDMAAISESKDNQRFLTHLKSKDFFDVETYPEARMTVVSLEHTEDNSYLVNGELTILNITQPLTFSATLTPQRETLRANANFTIDRTRWNITYDSGSIFSELGDRAIKDEIGFTLELAFTH